MSWVFLGTPAIGVWLITMHNKTYALENIRSCFACIYLRCGQQGNVHDDKLHAGGGNFPLRSWLLLHMQGAPSSGSHNP